MRTIRGDEYPDGKAHGDAVLLGMLARTRIAELHALNNRQKNPADLCPVCAGSTWGRPGMPMDFTRRQCSDCGHIRAEPDED